MLSQELFKSTVDLADLVGLHLVMSQIAGKGQLKFMIAGVGWASAELIMTGYVDHFEQIEYISEHAIHHLPLN